MKRILILRTSGNKPTDENKDWQDLRDGVAESLQNAEVVIAALTDLIYDANGAHTTIWHQNSKWDIAQFDLVIFRHVGKNIELGIAAAHYLAMKKVPFIDGYLLTEGGGKLAGAFLRVAHNIPVPRTVYASSQNLERIFSDQPPFSFPVILKADSGKKGNDNFLVTSIEHMHTILSASAVELVAQPFISNEGDYRLLVLNGTPALAIHRRGREGSHLNNTSLGGTATIVPVSDFSQQIITDALAATKLERLTVAGVDVLIERDSHRHYILEVNRAPQLATGAFVQEKLAAYGNMVQELLDRK